MIANPGGTNERFDRAHLHAAQIVVYPDNLTIFDKIARGEADLMITDASETRFQQKQHAGVFCAIHPGPAVRLRRKGLLDAARRRAESNSSTNGCICRWRTARSRRSTPNGSNRAPGAWGGMNFLGIDCGTSALKAVLVDEQERVLGACDRRAIFPTIPSPLWSEQDPDVWRDAMFAALGELAREAPAAMGAARGIGFSGQMHSAVLLDATTGRCARRSCTMIRARLREARELAERHPELAEIVGVKPMAGFTAPKLMWLARHEPEDFRARRQRAAAQGLSAPQR